MKATAMALGCTPVLLAMAATTAPGLRVARLTPGIKNAPPTENCATMNGGGAGAGGVLGDGGGAGEGGGARMVGGATVTGEPTAAAAVVMAAVSTAEGPEALEACATTDTASTADTVGAEALCIVTPGDAASAVLTDDENAGLEMVATAEAARAHRSGVGAWG